MSNEKLSCGVVIKLLNESCYAAITNMSVETKKLSGDSLNTSK